MTKISRRALMKLDRVEMPARDPIERAGSFEEVNVGLTPEDATVEAMRCLQCRTRTCIDVCPVEDCITMERLEAGAVDPRTGKVKVEFMPDVETHWFHHRCYRGKATDNYLLLPKRAVEFVDLHGERHHLERTQADVEQAGERVERHVGDVVGLALGFFAVALGALPRVVIGAGGDLVHAYLDPPDGKRVTPRKKSVTDGREPGSKGERGRNTQERNWSRIDPELTQY